MADVRTNAASFKWSWFENPDALLGAPERGHVDLSSGLRKWEAAKALCSRGLAAP
jgi:hypothetical protein